MLNKVILMGRLTKDPELRATASDISVASFTLAVDRGVKRTEPGEMRTQQTVDFINIIAWRSKAEVVCRWFKKGMLVAVSGRLQVRSYEDREGNRRYVTEVVAEEVFFAEKKSGGDPSTAPVGSAQDDTGGAPVGSAQDDTGASGPRIAASNNGEWEELFGDDEDLPF